MPDDVDPQLLVDAILLHVEDLEAIGTGNGDAWLKDQFNAALKAALSTDRVSQLSMESESTSFEVNMPPKQLLAILTQARRERPDADGNTNPAGGMLIPRLADFPLT